MKKFQWYSSNSAIHPNPPTVLMHYNQRVNITHWISPLCFYVRPLKIEPEFQLLSDDLRKTIQHERPLTRSLPVGSFVIADLTTLGEVFRAKIISVNDVTQSYDIHCMDTGKPLRDVQQECVFTLPQRFIETPPFTIKCCLPQIIATVDLPTLEGFAKSLCDDCDQLWCTFTSTNGDKTNCELKCNDTCVRTTLIFKGLVDTIPEGVNLNIMIGQTILAKIKRFKSLSFFQVGISGSLNTFYCTYTHFNLLTDGIRVSHNFGYAYNGKSVPLRVDTLSDNNWLVVTPLVSLLHHERPIMRICNMAVCKQSLEVKLMHIASANIVHVTQIEHENHYIRLSNRMQAFYNSQYSQPYCKLVNICAVKDDNNIWHRAEVMTSDQDLYTVRLIDTGERNVYHVDRLKSLASSFAEDPAIALRIYMLHESIAEESTVMNNLKQYRQMVVSLRIIEFYNGHWIGEIELGDNNIVQMLHNQNLVLPVDVNYVKLQIANTESNFIDGVKIDAVVTHTISPNQFYVQRMVDIGDLRELERDLDQTQFHPLENFTVNTMCIAQYSDDKKWYRAKILDNDANEISVFFVDYGYTDYINDRSLLRELPHFYGDASPFSICCSLPVTPRAGHWTYQNTAVFKRVVKQQPNLRFSYIKQLPELNYVELYVEEGNNSVSEMLINQKIAYKYLKFPKKCYITHVNSLSSFYVQDDDSTPKLEQLIQMLQSNVDKSNIVEVPCEGLLCLARSSPNDQWYRARVLCHETRKVFYIDYGNTGKAIEMRYLSNSAYDILAMATHCALRIPDDVEKWTTRSEELFKALAKDSNKVFEMNITLLGIPDVVELFFEGTNIVDCLDILTTSYEEEHQSIVWHDISTTTTDATNAEYSITGRQRQRSRVMLQTVVSHDEFYVVRMGVDVETLETIAHQLNDPNGGPKLPEYKGVRSLSAAKYDVDGMYYRAMCLSALSNPKKLVYFIDYGNTDMSSDVRCLPDDLYNYKHLSKRCCLVKHSFNQLIYEHNFSELFMKALIPFWQEPFEIEVREKIGTTAVVDLFHRGKRFVDKITEDGSIPFVEPTPSNWDSFSQRNDSFRDTTNHNLSARLSEIMGDNNKLESPGMPLTWSSPDPKLLYKKGKLVYSKSPSQFYVMLEENFFEYTKIKKSTSCMDIIPLPSPKCGDLCVAIDMNKHFHRARILKILVASYSVMFIDLGYLTNTPVVYVMPEDVHRIPALVTTCCLLNQSIKWPESMREEFLGYDVTYGRMSSEMLVIDKADDGTYVVELYYDGIRIVDELFKCEKHDEYITGICKTYKINCDDKASRGRELRQWPDNRDGNMTTKEVDITRKDANRNTLEPLIVTAIEENNAYMFYARAPEFQQFYETLCSYINHFKSYRVPLVKKMCSKDTLYAIKCADSTYARCLVLRHILENTYIIRLVDTGRTVAMNVDEVFTLSDEFATMPYQAKKYKIAAGKSFSDSVTSIVGVEQITQSDIGKTIQISAPVVDDDDVCHVDVYYSTTQNSGAVIETSNSDFNDNDSFGGPIEYVEDCNVTILEGSQSPISRDSQSNEYGERAGNFHRDAFYFKKMQNATNYYNSAMVEGPSRSKSNEGFGKSDQPISDSGMLSTGKQSSEMAAGPSRSKSIEGIEDSKWKYK